MRIAWLVAAAGVLLEVAFDGRYGYFRDELYFIATSNHLAAGYVDFAPLSSWLLRLVRLLLGDSLHALRILPALAYGAEIVLTGLIVRELGGKRFATFLACASVMLAPVVVGSATRYSMNPFEPLFWMGSIYVLLRVINGANPKSLIWLGVLIGLGIENKHSTVFFVVALLAAVALTEQRKLFREKWFWVAVAVAFALTLPNLIWQIQHGFPTYVDLSNVKRTHKNVELPPLPFFKQQIMMLNPAAAIVWLTGVAYLLFARTVRRYRAIGVTYLVFLAIMMGLHAKDYYLSPIYPVLFAAGAVFWEKLAQSQRRWAWLHVALPLLVLPLGIAVLPFTVPILPVEKIGPYLASFGAGPSKTETHHSGPLPQHFSDEFGWEDMVAAVAKVYNAMPPEQRAKTAILAGNYGEAGSIDFFGARYGLPKAISAHQNYYYWGPRDYTGENLILLQWDLSGAQHWCHNVDVGPALAPQWGMEEEHFTVLVCHGLKMPLTEAWDHFKHWN
jgi:4-amino-4-deoxy-L-arabinose transferase-like glycosyltransferase